MRSAVSEYHHQKNRSEMVGYRYRRSTIQEHRDRGDTYNGQFFTSDH